MENILYLLKEGLEKMSLKQLINYMKKLAVLISDAGTGTNLQAVIDAIKNKKLKAEIVSVISSSKKAYGLQRAKKNNIPTIVVDKKDNLKKILDDLRIDLVVLSGWKLIIPKILIDGYKNKIFNL